MAGETGSIIYHYCSAEAFLGIIQSKSIRLTSIFYMNDADEHHYLRKKVATVVKKERRRREWADPVNEVFDSLEARTALWYAAQIYCACFSKDQDSLGQWRAYADDGRGFAIGFDREYFESICGVELRLVDVLYDPQDHMKIATSIVKSATDAAMSPGKLRAFCGPDEAEGKLWREAIRCKNPTFAEEKEVRLVWNPARMEEETYVESLDFRASGGLLIPYHALRLDPTVEPHPIRKIKLGPKNHRELNESSLAMLLSYSGFGSKRGIPCECSESSYRSNQKR